MVCVRLGEGAPLTFTFKGDEIKHQASMWDIGHIMVSDSLACRGSVRHEAQSPVDRTGKDRAGRPREGMTYPETPPTHSVIPQGFHSTALPEAIPIPKC